ncbi:hypothetical protein AB0P19_14920, partial [Microbacterium oleivorans]|uniref:hypothetical protein n=1 Tax=Microbacterium TaxID=33882 RepID=UPI0033C78F9F
INAQSSKVITLQSLSVHFSSAATVQFSSAVDTRHEKGDGHWREASAHLLFRLLCNQFCQQPSGRDDRI